MDRKRMKKRRTPTPSRRGRGVTLPGITTNKRQVSKTIPMEMEKPEEMNSASPRRRITSKAEDVAAKLILEKEERERRVLAAQLDRIYERIGKLYENAGFPGNVKASKDEEATALQIAHRPPNYDGKRLQKIAQKREKRRSLLKRFTADSLKKFQLIQDFGDWLNSIDLGVGLKTEEVYEQERKEHLESQAEADAGYSHALDTISEIKRIGYRLLEDAGYLDQDEEVDVNDSKKGQKFGLPPEKILDTKTLVEDKSGEAYNEASSEVKRVMKDSIRLVKTPKAKTMVRGGLKQYKNLMGANEKRRARALDLENEVLEKNNQLVELEASNESLRLEVKEISNAEKVLKEKIMELERVTVENKNLKKKVTDEGEKVKELQKKTAKVPSRIGTVDKEKRTETKVKFAGSIQSVPKTESQIRREELASSALKEEVNEYKVKVEKLEQEMEEMAAKLEAERAKTKTLQLQLEGRKEGPSAGMDEGDMQDKEDLEKKPIESVVESENQMEQTTDLEFEKTLEDEVSVQQENKQPEPDSEVKLEKRTESPTVVKKTLTSGKQKGRDKAQKSPGSERGSPKGKNRSEKMNDAEINRLKAYLEKEKQRHEAAIRKLEQYHKDQISQIHKETVRLLRSINRFKESVAQILDKEELVDAAFDIQKLANLTTEFNTQDPKMLLNRISHDAVELLVAMGTKLSQALMNRRLEMKDECIAKTMTSKDLDIQIDITTRLRQKHNQLIEKYNTVKEELVKAENAIKAVEKAENKRYANLYDRYKVLWTQWNGVQKELHNLKRDFLEMIKEKEAAYRSAMIVKQNMSKTIGDQQEALVQMNLEMIQRKTATDNKFRMSMRDMRQNLITLKEAFEDHRITRDMYQSAVDIIDRSMKIPIIRLYHLFSRYIAFRRLKHFIDVMKDHLADINEDSPEAITMKSYVMKVERNIQIMTTAWQDKTGDLDEERKELFGAMSELFTDTVTTTQLLTKPPTQKLLPSLHEEESDAGSSRDQVSPLSRGVTFKWFKTVFPKLESSHALVGQKISGSESAESVWKPVPFPPVMAKSSPALPKIEIPKLLVYDINRPYKQAQKELKKTIKAAYPVSQAEFYDYSTPRIVSMTKVDREKPQARLRPSVEIMIPTGGSA